MFKETSNIMSFQIPNDLFILNPTNQYFLLGTRNYWWVGQMFTEICLWIAIPVCLISYLLTNPLNDLSVNLVCVTSIGAVAIISFIWVMTRRYLSELKLTRMKRDGQILFGRITNIKTEIYRTRRGEERRNSKVRYEFKNPSGKDLAAYTKHWDLVRTPHGKSVAILYVSDDDFMAL